MDVILTGASRGIGRALALALPPSTRLHAVARDARALEELARTRPNTVVHVGDLSSTREATRLGRALAASCESGATLVHSAGIWPSRRELVSEGDAQLERAFVVNHLAALALQRPLLEERKLARVLVIGAGLMIKGRFDPDKTPTGADFSGFRTYCTTKLCFAVAMRDVAAAHPEVDVAVIHPGVVRTELGARSGPLGWLLSRIKRGWEAPEVTAQRLVRVLSRDRWSAAGEARWFVEETETEWPSVADDARARIREVTARLA